MKESKTINQYLFLMATISGGKKYCLLSPDRPYPNPTDCKLFFSKFSKNIYKANRKLIIGYQKCKMYKVFTRNQVFYPSFSCIDTKYMGQVMQKRVLSHMRTTNVQISLRSLISTFVFRCLDSMICIIAISKVSRF